MQTAFVKRSIAHQNNEELRNKNKTAQSMTMTMTTPDEAAPKWPNSQWYHAQHMHVFAHQAVKIRIHLDSASHMVWQTLNECAQ